MFLVWWGGCYKAIYQSRCLVLFEVRMNVACGQPLGQGGGDLVENACWNCLLLKLPCGPPLPLVPLKPWTTLTDFKMWSPESRDHKYLMALNLPSSFLREHCLFRTAALEVRFFWGRWSWGCGLSGKKADRAGGRFRFHWWLGTWWHDVLTSSGRGHVEQNQDEPLKSCTNICIFYCFIALWTSGHLQQVAGQYSNINATEWIPVSQKVQTGLPGKIHTKEKIQERTSKHLKAKTPKNTKASRNKDCEWNMFFRPNLTNSSQLLGEFCTHLLDRRKKAKALNLISVKFGVIVKFTCQLDWTMGCPDICPNIILNVPVFLDELKL